jgi:3-oxoadipate enol-lactonase
LTKRAVMPYFVTSGMPRLEINNVILHYEVSGLGPPVIFCHGYSGSHQDWLHQVSALNGDHTVVTFDYRGHGSSAAPAGVDAYSVPLFAADVLALADTLKIDKFSLAGHSMGGFVALQVALDFPARLDSLVLVDTSAGPVDMPDQGDLQSRLAEIARAEGMAAAFEYNAAHNPLALRGYQLFPWHRELARRRLLETSVDGYVYAGRALAEREDMTPRLGEINVPTLIMVGEADTPFRRPAEALARGIPGARLEIIPRAAHSPNEETAPVFNALLADFLKTVRRG